MFKPKKQAPFRISNRLIWISSISLGILTSIPKIVDHHFDPAEGIADFAVTSGFALLIWYYNIYTIPAYTKKTGRKSVISSQLFKGLGVGLVLMFLLSSLQYYILSHLNFGPKMLMYEVRGILINLTFYMFIHILYQTHLNQQVVRELERSMAANLEAQYELLKQQVNPHFLFNSLNTLKYMVDSHDGQSSEFIIKLADFYRFTLDSLKLNVLPLKQELAIMESYIYLLKARFEEGLLVTQNLGAELAETLIPPFTLQLLIENCIKHNIVSLEKPLHIRLYREADYLVVENNLQERKIPESSTGLGIKNINQRYLLLTDKEIVILKTNDTFTIKLPILYEHPNH
ncbi:sensor histidine kinase [Sphingobacterium thalpophilum]|uniref:Histidine kinase n=1 Tax=Sphingobacterium thalpophilum TaxID=259 RepID=A0A4U9VLU5_9SPHI|nr:MULTISPECIES: histidine kinase [Sphingobacterium]MCW8311186.1 histidine kinase [Sphingobacterium sp. InxBP1]VTR48165.1 Probable sensor-like histidine kinase YehU [Sphingobacterium thalpophilum]